MFIFANALDKFGLSDLAFIAHQADRPDLLLAANVESRHLLLEFKRPSIPVGRDAEHQAVKYADNHPDNDGYDKIPQAMHYARTKATPQDWFIAGDTYDQLADRYAPA